MKRGYLVVLALILIVAAATFFVNSRTERPAAVVNGHPISALELENGLAERIKMHRGTGATLSAEMLREAVLNQLISEELIAQGAAKAGIEITPEEIMDELKDIKARSGQAAFTKFLQEYSMTEQQYLEMLRLRMMKDRFVDTVIFPGDIPEEELRKIYSESPVPFLTSEAVEVRLMEFATKDEAAAAMKEIKAGNGDFDEVAERIKKNENVFVSDYGQTSPEYYSGEIGNAMKQLKAGQYGGPYEGQDGYFIMRVRSRTHKRPKTFDEARQEIRNMLYERRRDAAVIHWVAEKKKTANIIRN